MAKIRIYELATKMGLGNKDVVEKLQQAGIEVKNHMSAIEEDVAQKFEADQAAKTIDAPQAEENVEVKVKEERISSGLIRRRRKTVVKEEPQAEVADAAAETSDEAAAVTEEAAEQDAAPAAEPTRSRPGDHPVAATVRAPGRPQTRRLCAGSLRDPGLSGPVPAHQHARRP